MTEADEIQGRGRTRHSIGHVSKVEILDPDGKSLHQKNQAMKLDNRLIFEQPTSKAGSNGMRGFSGSNFSLDRGERTFG